MAGITADLQATIAHLASVSATHLNAKKEKRRGPKKLLSIQI